MKRHRERVRGLSPPRLLASVYLVLILVGTLLMWVTPVASTPMGLSEALFTATSSATVTGLAVVDPASFTVWGELLVMLLMQLGGLGLMTFAVFTALLLGRRIGLRQRVVAGDALSTDAFGGVTSLVRTLVVFTVLVEAAGAAVLATRLVPELGWREGLWESVFHAVSAFNNAGVALRTDNLVPWAGDPVIALGITLLLITGGIGFTVVAEVWRRRRWSLLSLHTRLMLVGTLAVNVAAFVLMFLLEYDNPDTLGPLALREQAVVAWLQAVSPRTAGFNMVDMADLREPTILLTMLLMFVGGGSASTAGGIKLTTAIVLALATISYIRGHREPHAFGRSIAPGTVLRALTVVVISSVVLVFGTFLLSIVEDAPLDALAFEATSAFATVGLSLGVTGELGDPGRLVVVTLMYLGRIGPLALAYSFARRHSDVLGYPRGDVMTG